MIDFWKVWLLYATQPCYRSILIADWIDVYNHKSWTTLNGCCEMLLTPSDLWFLHFYIHIYLQISSSSWRSEDWIFVNKMSTSVTVSRIFWWPCNYMHVEILTCQSWLPSCGRCRCRYLEWTGWGRLLPTPLICWPSEEKLAPNIWVSTVKGVWWRRETVVFLCGARKHH